MLKETSQTICKPLCVLFNRSFDEVIFPNICKNAIVMPLFKKGEADTPSNYRPMSLLHCIDKVMGMLVHKYICNHLHFNGLLYSSKYGFKPRHSTVYQLIEIYNKVCESRQVSCIVLWHITQC